DIWILFCAFLKTLSADEAQLAVLNGDDRRRPRLPINDGELVRDLPGPENGQDPLFAPRRSYDDFEKALLQPVAAVAGIPGGKKRVTGTEVARFGALQTIGPTAVRAGGTIWRWRLTSASRVLHLASQKKYVIFVTEIRF